MHFFVEVDALGTQAADQAFGPVPSAEATTFRLGSLHTTSAVSRAIAVCSGQLIGQSIDANRLCLVLKPFQQFDGLPTVRYFVYRGVRASSIVDATGTIAARTNNDLTRSIWESRDAVAASFTDATGEPAGIEPTEDILGLGVPPAGSTQVDELYAQANVVFPVVKAGWHIGDFEAGTIGFEVVLDHVGSPLSLADVQRLDPTLVVPQALPDPSDADTFTRRHAMDRALYAIDPAAFYGAYGGVVTVFRNGTTEALDAQALYDDVLSRFFSKHHVYFYLSDELNRSFDIDGSYPSSVTLAVGAGASGTSVSTRTHDWPLFHIEPSPIDQAALSGDVLPLGLSLPVDPGAEPLLFVSTGSPHKLTTGPGRDPRFVRVIPDAGGVSLPVELALATVSTSGGARAARPGFVGLKYARGYDFAALTGVGSGTGLRRGCLLDAVFQPFAMGLDPALTGQTVVRICHGQLLVDDPTRMPGAAAMSTGIAMDSDRVAFIAYPSAKERATLGSPLNLLEERTVGASNFLEELEETAGITLVRRILDVTGTPLEYVVLESVGDGPDAELLASNPDDLHLIIIARSEYATLEQQLQTSTLNRGLPVYLGVDVGRGPAPEIETIHLSIRGFDTSSGTPQVVTVDSGITIQSPTVIV